MHNYQLSTSSARLVGGILVELLKGSYTKTPTENGFIFDAENRLFKLHLEMNTELLSCIAA